MEYISQPAEKNEQYGKVHQEISRQCQNDTVSQDIQDGGCDAANDHIVRGAQTDKERPAVSFLRDINACELRYGNLCYCCEEINGIASREQIQF